MISSVAPDIDYAARIWGVETFLAYHRGPTHGVLALALAPGLMALIAAGFKREFFYYYFVGFLGYGVHILMDLTNQYGTKALWPISDTMYSLDLIFIIDPYILIALSSALVLIKMRKDKAVLIAATVFVLLACNVGLKYHLHEKAMKNIRQQAGDYVVRRVSPFPASYLRWWFVVENHEEYKTGMIDMLLSKVYFDRVFAKPGDDQRIYKSRGIRTVKIFLDFARLPHASVENRADGASVVTWRELSFTFLPGEHFSAKVFFDRDQKLVKSYFKF